MTINVTWPAGSRVIECIQGAKFALSCTYQDVAALTVYSDLVYDNKVSVSALSGAMSVSGNVLTTRTLDTTGYGGKKLVLAITATEDSGPITVKQIMVNVHKPGDEYFFEEEMTVRAGWTAAIEVKFQGTNKVTSGSVKVYQNKNDVTANIASGSTSQSGNIVTTPTLNTTNFGGKVVVVTVTATLDAGPIWVCQIKMRILKSGEEA